LQIGRFYPHPAFGHLLPAREKANLETWCVDAKFTSANNVYRLAFARNGIMDDVEIERMQWLPNGKQISFLYDHGLYLLDVPPYS
jgi:hypothetical protein